MRPVFFDTNIFVSADDDSEPSKQERAIQLIAEHRRMGTLAISPQVLQEDYVTTTRKLGVDPAIAESKTRLLAKSNVVRFTAEDVIAAIELHRFAKISMWNALIVQAARVAGAAVLYSEDLQHGGVIGGIAIVNPFRTE